MKLDQLEQHLFIGEERKRWPDEVGAFLNMQIWNKRQYPVLVLELTLSDQLGIIGKQYQIEDGTLLEIVETSNGSPNTYRFRVYSIVAINTEGTKVYRIRAYEDQLAWFAGTTTKSLKGTSSEVLMNLAAESGLSFEGDATQDSQVWLGFGRKRFVFAREIAAHGWAGESAAMSLAYRPGTVIYKDLNKLPKTPKWKMSHDGFGSKEKNRFGITSYRPLNESGQAGLSGAYRETFVDHNVSDLGARVFDKIPLQKMGAVGSVGSKIRSLIDGDQLRSGMTSSSDNTHAQYQRALYQNRRAMKMFSQTMLVTVGEQTDIQLYDTVHCQVSGKSTGLVGASSDPESMYDGVYFVDAKIICLRGNQRAEMFVLRSNSVNL